MNYSDFHNHQERMMELSDLHVFRTVVNAGGITKAAAQLNRVQSNVTTRVRQLEQDLGVELFIREGKKLKLSEAGRVLLGYADRLLALASEAREALQDSSPRGLLRLGSMESTAAVRLPGPLSTYSQRYPAVTLELHTAPTDQLASAVLAGELDAALVAEPVTEGPFDVLPIFKEELVLIAKADHPPIRSAEDLRKRAILGFETGCAYRARLEAWFKHHGFMPERIIEMSSYHAMFGCAVAGMGIALLPRSLLQAFPGSDALSTHAIDGEYGTAWTVLIRRKGSRSPNVEALIELLTKGTPSKPAQSPKAAARGRRPQLTAA
jgi:DNA-binding transcriptional LysR family regulator